MNFVVDCVMFIFFSKKKRVSLVLFQSLKWKRLKIKSTEYPFPRFDPLQDIHQVDETKLKFIKESKLLL